MIVKDGGRREEKKDPVYCARCSRWYALTRVDQCDLPFTEQEYNNEAIGTHLVKKIPIAPQGLYGKPSELNANHNCPYYSGIGLLQRLVRKVFLGISMKPSVESKV